MRIALDEIDPHVAAMYAVTAPASKTHVPAPRRQGVRLSRRRQAALAAVIAVPPILGLQLAVIAAEHTPTMGWVPWVVWFGTSGAMTGLGCRVLLKGRMTPVSAALMALTVFAAPALGCTAAMFAFWSRSSPNLAFWTTWLAMSLPLALLGSRLALSVVPQKKQVTSLQTDNMREVFASLSLTRAERIYCDALLFLARSETRSDTEPIMRDTLRQINELVASSRQLEQQRLALLPLMGANVEPELQAERESLETRLQSATDPISRNALEQSRRMVDTRLENARNLKLGMERLTAQQEAVTQTLASTLSSLARLQMTSGAASGFAVQEVTQAAAHMNQQTIAVEKAVEEVLTLRQ